MLEHSTCVCYRTTSCLSYKELLEKGLIKLHELPTDLDMAWYPVKNAWYCVKCFEEFILPICEEDDSPPPEYYEELGDLYDESYDDFYAAHYFLNRRYWYIEDGVIYPVPGSERKKEHDVWKEYIKYFNYE